MHNDKPGNPARWQDRIDDAPENSAEGWNKAAAWQQLSEQLHPGDKKRRMVWLPRRWMVAAALLLAVGAATTWYLLPRQQHEQEPPVVKAGKPGGVEQPFEVKSIDSPLQATAVTDIAGKALAAPAASGNRRKTLAEPQEKALKTVMPRFAVDTTALVQLDEAALTQQFINPLTPKKRKVFHQNNISTPAELLSIQPGREQRRMSLFRQPAEPVPQPATPLVIPLNN